MNKNITLTEDKVTNIADIIGAGMTALLPYTPVALRSPLTQATIEVSAQMVVDIVNILTGGLSMDEINMVGDAMMNKASKDMAELVAEIDSETDVVKPDEAMEMLFQLMAENSDILKQLKD